MIYYTILYDRKVFFMTELKRKKRAKGQGSIFLRNGIYQLEYMVNRQRKKVSLGVSHKADKRDADGNLIKGAETLAREMLQPAKDARTKEEVLMQIAAQRNLIQPDALKIDSAFDVFETLYKRDHAITPDTWLNYVRQWNRFEVWLKSNYPGITELRLVTEEIAREYWTLFQELSASTANQHLTTLKAVFHTLKKQADLFRNPFEDIPRRSADGISRKYLSEAEAAKIMQSFEPGGANALLDPAYKILFEHGRNLGQRLEDCVLLEWQAVCFKTPRQIQLMPLKTQRIKRIVTIPIFPPYSTLLERLYQERDPASVYVLPRLASGYLRNPDTIKRTVSAVFQRCGYETSILLPGRKYKTSVIGFYCFRGSLATNLLNRGIPPSIVAAIIGDNLTTIQKHYVKVSEKHIHDAFRKVKK